MTKYISLKDLKNKNATNQKFFELLDKCKTRKEFVIKWNEWVENESSEYSCLDFSNFNFDINDSDIKNTFKFLITYNKWNFCEITFPELNLRESCFKQEVVFQKNIFLGDLDFEGSTLNDAIDLSNSKFKSDFHSFNISIKKNISIYNSTFEKDVNFQEINIISESIIITLDKSKFKGNLIFSISEESQYKIKEIKKFTTSFSSSIHYDIAKIEKIPDFDSANIPNNQQLKILDHNRDIKELIKLSAGNIQFLKKYYREKLDHGKYIQFAAAELEKKIKNPEIFNKNKLIPRIYIIPRIYKIFSNYGMSIKRPFIWWFGFNFTAILLFIGKYFCDCSNLIEKAQTAKLATQTAIKSLIPFYFSKDLNNIGPEFIFFYLQTPINIILIFFIILGIKNSININK